MADTKVSALANIASGAVASGDKFPVADVSDLTVTYYATAGNIKSFAQNAPVFAAGSASAGSWPVFTSGTLLTTAEDGAWEIDADCLYACTDAGNRGYVPVRHFVRADGAGSLAATTGAQRIFDGLTNGRITLETGTYILRALIYVTAMDAAAASNAAIDWLGSGTAATGSWLWYAYGRDAVITGVGTMQGSAAVTSASGANIVTGVATGNLAFVCRGTFEVTAAGTMIPQISLAVADASTLNVGSYVMIERIGSTSVVSVGQWD